MLRHGVWFQSAMMKSHSSFSATDSIEKCPCDTRTLIAADTCLKDNAKTLTIPIQNTHYLSKTCDPGATVACFSLVVIKSCRRVALSQLWPAIGVVLRCMLVFALVCVCASACLSCLSCPSCPSGLFFLIFLVLLPLSSFRWWWFLLLLRRWS